MQKTLLPPHVQYLLQPKLYGCRSAQEISLIETHISYVILAPERVYKWKKPVDFGFVNFSTLQRRKHFCEEELRLNRRLCPDIYLGLVWLSKTPDWSFKGDGLPVEYGIEMRRMPEEQMMGNIIARNELTEYHIDALLAVLLPFYRQAESGDRINENGTASAVSQNIFNNFRETASFVGSSALPSHLFEHIKSYSQRFLDQDFIFADRIRQQKIRDCHGDLHSANICLADRPYIFDCIEFNPNLRYIDIAADIAFLAMDLDYNGLERLAGRFIAGYQSVTGDQTLATVLTFYKCYRAYVRGKVALLTTLSEDLNKAEKEGLFQKAKSYFELAGQYATTK